VNYKTQDFAKGVERVTGGHGADVVIDFIGPSHWDMNIAALAPDWRMVMLRFLSGRELEKVDLGPL
jgi:NADPH:quinone reductase-like Zn-dependent oxidoreductase